MNLKKRIKALEKRVAELEDNPAIATPVKLLNIRIPNARFMGTADTFHSLVTDIKFKAEESNVGKYYFIENMGRCVAVVPAEFMHTIWPLSQPKLEGHHYIFFWEEKGVVCYSAYERG